MDFPENVAKMDSGDTLPLKVQSPLPPHPPQEKVEQAADIISQAKYPIIMAGNGVIRAHASEQLVDFAEKLNIPVATTFMAKGVIPSSHNLSLGSVGLAASDYISCGFNQADVIICVGYDIVEYHPHLWHKEKNRKIIHIDSLAAEVDEHYIVEVGVIGSISNALAEIAVKAQSHTNHAAMSLRDAIVDEMSSLAEDSNFPVKPQKIMWDLRTVLNNEDIVISDVGAHKMWMARMYQAEAPNTCIISNGFASMGIAVPGAIAAKLANPEKTIVAVTGDAGFMMNSQEVETAMRIGTPIVIIIWTDSKYGLIEWHQLKAFGKSSYVDFNNPDFVQYAHSFGAKGYRVKKTGDLVPTIKQAIADNTVVIIDCPVDYAENMKLTEKLGDLVCPI